jgi:hypothetical protein
MGEEPENKGGRPKNVAPRHTIEMRAVDPVTYRMIESLVAYGRFGGSNPDVALFIIRNWLMEKEEYLRTAIANRKTPLGDVLPEVEDAAHF